MFLLNRKMVKTIKSVIAMRKMDNTLLLCCAPGRSSECRSAGSSNGPKRIWNRTISILSIWHTHRRRETIQRPYISIGSKSSTQHDSPKAEKQKGKGLQPKQSGIFRVKWIVLCHFSFQTAHGRSTNLGFQIHQKAAAKMSRPGLWKGFIPSATA